VFVFFDPTIEAGDLVLNHLVSNFLQRIQHQIHLSSLHFKFNKNGKIRLSHSRQHKQLRYRVSFAYLTFSYMFYTMLNITSTNRQTAAHTFTQRLTPTGGNKSLRVRQ
jgi:hypothetical protein